MNIDTYLNAVFTEVKALTQSRRTTILDGELTEAEYRRQAGFLEGADWVCKVAIEEANKMLRAEAGEVDVQPDPTPAPMPAVALPQPTPAAVPLVAQGPANE